MRGETDVYSRGTSEPCYEEAPLVIADRYRLDEMEDRGHWFVTWRAWDLDEGIPVGIRLLRQGSSWAWPQLRSSFAALTGIEHPAMATVLDLIEDDEHSGVVREWRTGSSLEQDLADRPRTGNGISARWEWLRPILLDLLDLLDHLHRCGVVLRCLPLRELGVDDFGRVVLADASMAAPVDGSLDSRFAVAGMRVAAWSAPEMFTSEAVGQTADLYSLGLLTCHLLFGGAPASKRRTRDDEPPQALELPPMPGLPGPAGEFLRAVLAVDPANRPPTARAAQEILAPTPRPTPNVPPPELPPLFDKPKRVNGLIDRYFSEGLAEWMPGGGRVVVLAGPSGAGKTEAIEAWARHATDSGLCSVERAVPNPDPQRGGLLRVPEGATGPTELRPEYAAGAETGAAGCAFADFSPRVLFLDQLDDLDSRGLWSLQQILDLVRVRPPLPFVLVLGVQEPTPLLTHLVDLDPSVLGLRADDSPGSAPEGSTAAAEVVVDTTAEVPFDLDGMTGGFIVRELRAAGRLMEALELELGVTKLLGEPQTGELDASGE